MQGLASNTHLTQSLNPTQVSPALPLMSMRAPGRNAPSIRFFDFVIRMLPHYSFFLHFLSTPSQTIGLGKRLHFVSSAMGRKTTTQSMRQSTLTSTVISGLCELIQAY